MPGETELHIPDHVLAERNPARALRLLLDVPGWRELVAGRHGLRPEEVELDEDSFGAWARYCEEPMTPREMSQADETFERVVDDFILGRDEIEIT